MRQAMQVAYRFNAYAVGNTREELEKSARAHAEEYFGTTRLTFLSADVSTEQAEAGNRYGGTFSFEEKDPEQMAKDRWHNPPE